MAPDAEAYTSAPECEGEGELQSDTPSWKDISSVSASGKCPLETPEEELEVNVKCGESRIAGLLGGLSSSTYKGAYRCVTPVGGDEDVVHESVESLNVRLSLETCE